MKRRLKSQLFIVGIFFAMCILSIHPKVLNALTDKELKSYMNEYKAGNYGENQIFLSADGNFVVYTKARPHTSGTVHTFFGYEISKLQNKDGKVVNPFNAEYSAYNASMVAKGTTSSDPHFYNGSNRISFVINRFLQSPAGVRDSSTAWVSESTDGGDNITVISRALIKNGIMQSHDQEWIDQWNAWDNDPESNEFAFGFDGVQGATYGGEYKDYYHKGNFLNGEEPKGLYDSKGVEHPELGGADQVTRANGRYNYRRNDYQWGFGLTSGVAGHTTDSAQWQAYNKDAYLRVGSYGGSKPAITWNTYMNDGTFASLVKDEYKRYFSTVRTSTPPTPPPSVKGGQFTQEDTEVTLTKDEGGKDNVSVGQASGDQVSGDGLTAPNVHTWNNDSSGAFNIGDAIPTTESYDNYVSLDTWYGSVKIQKVNLNYKSTANITVKYWQKVEIAHPVYDADMNVIDHYYTYEPQLKVAGIKQVTNTWKTADHGKTFYRISDVNLFNLNSAVTTNDSIGSIQYNASNLGDTSVPYVFTINGTTVTNGGVTSVSPDCIGEGAWINNTNYVRYGRNSTSEADQARTVTLPGVYDVGVVPSDAEVTSAANNKHKEVLRGLELLNTYSDSMTIAGHQYLDSTRGILDGIGFGGTHEMSETDASYNNRQGSERRQIPVDIHNGKYYTDLEATYGRIVTASSKRSLVGNTKLIRLLDRTYKDERAILSGWEHNEPVIVFSPVMSPIHVEDDNDTQLVNDIGNTGRPGTDRITQLRLDGKYKLVFDWMDYFQEMGYGNPAGFTKYVDEKYLSFPFAIRVNGKYYDVLSTTGYTEWIPVGATTTEVEIYVPSWAEEGMYGGTSIGYTTDDFYKVNNRPLRVRCDANNVPADFPSASWEGLSTQDEHNTNPNPNGDDGTNIDSNYVATFHIPVQVSGWIYGFQVDAVHDELGFAPSDWEDKYGGEDIYNLVVESANTAYREAERRVGVFNRLGFKLGVDNFSIDQRHFVRYTLDGNITNDWKPYNTLTMTSGKNPDGDSNGFLQLGKTISYTIKTIANLSGDNDSVHIDPTYRYVSTDGTQNEDIDIWYKDSPNGPLIKMDSQADIENRKMAYLYDKSGSIYFEDAYYDYKYNTFKQTAYYLYGKDNDITPVQKAKGEENTVGDILIPSTMRLITGNEEELVSNIANGKTSATSTRYNVANGSTSGLNGTNLGDWNITKKEYGWKEGDSYDSTMVAPNYNFMNSMQTWYGMYTIPNYLYVCPKNAVEDYMSTTLINNIDGSEDFWYTDGYLVLNFDIKTLQDGNEHLKYGSNMYANENQNDPDRPVPPENTVHPDPDPSDDPTIPEKPGDVGIIPIKYPNVADHYASGIVNLN